MAKEIVTWCDKHLGEGVQVSGASVVVKVDRIERRLDLCPACRSEILGPVVALLEEHGVKVDEAAPPIGLPSPNRGPRTDNERRFVCLWCPDAFVTSYGLTDHIKRLHNFPTNKGTAIFGDTCPLCGFVSDTGKPGIHVSQQHKELGLSLSQAFAFARDNGDPHGAYKEVFDKVAAYIKV